ncbi:MAG: PspC domain-containing protein [Candidatus Saccharimonadales bacterium]
MKGNNMNEITKIHLGRQAFTISVDAYKTLQAYLHEIKHQVGDKSKDVVDEVELRMAELLAERGVHGDKVILSEDVDYLKEQLGSPRDFKDDDDTTAEGKDKAQSEPDATPKRLFRDTKNAWLAGVCAGLGKYFGIDATIIRLIFIALLFFGGGGVLLYIVLWLIVPEARTTSEQLQMQGKPVTVGSLKQIVDRADIEGAAKRASTIARPVAMTIAKIILGVFGVLFTIIAVLLLLSVTMLGMYAWVHHGVSLGGDHFFPTGMKEALLLLCGLAVITVVALFFLLGGLTMLKPKWKAPGWLSAALGCVFILAAAGGATLFLDRAPVIRDRYDAIHHTASVTTQPFTKLDLQGQALYATHFIYKPSNEYKIEYKYIGKQSTAWFNKGVNNGVLTLDSGEKRGEHCTVFCDLEDNNKDIVIYAPTLESVTVRGMNTTFGNAAAFNQSDISFVVDQTANLDLRYMSPAKVQLVANPDEPASKLTITGMRADALQQDGLISWGQNFTLTRAGEVVFDTNAKCLANQAMLTLTNYPEKLTLRGQVFPTKGDLNAQRSPSDTTYDNQGGTRTGEPERSLYNCVFAD